MNQRHSSKLCPHCLGKILHWPCIFSSQRYWRRQTHWYFTLWWNQWQMTSALFSSGGIARCMFSNFTWATAMYTTNIPVNQKPSTIMKQKRIDWLTKSCCWVSNMAPFCKKDVMYLYIYAYVPSAPAIVIRIRFVLVPHECGTKLNCSGKTTNHVGTADQNYWTQRLHVSKHQI